MLAKLLPTKIADNNWSGFFRSSNALFALVFDFLDKFFNFILLAAIIPVSDPEKNPLSINKNTRVENAYERDRRPLDIFLHWSCHKFRTKLMGHQTIQKYYLS